MVALRDTSPKETVPLRNATSSRSVISMDCGELPGATERSDSNKLVVPEVADCTYKGPLGLTSRLYVPGAIFWSSRDTAATSSTCCETYRSSTKPALRATSWTYART